MTNIYRFFQQYDTMYTDIDYAVYDCPGSFLAYLEGVCLSNLRVDEAVIQILSTAITSVKNMTC